MMNRRSALLRPAAVAFLLLLVLLVLAGCSSGSQPQRFDPAGFALPAPKDLPHRASYDDLKRTKDGASYDASVGDGGTFHGDGVDMVFTPRWGSQTAPTISDCAGLIYTFPLTDFAEEARLFLDWTAAPANPGDLWIGVYNFNPARLRWEWYSEGVDGAGFDSPLSDYLDGEGQAWAAVVLLGSEEARLHSLRFGPQLWRRDDVDAGADEINGSTGIALDIAGNPHIAYHNVTTGSLMYASYSAGAWTTETVDPGPGLRDYASLAFDPAGNPHIAYFDQTNVHPMYAYNDGSWHVSVLDASGTRGAGTDIAFDSSGIASVVYVNMSGGGLTLARDNGPGWDYENFGSIASMGHCCLVLDSSDQPHVAYTSGTDLRYAFRAAGTWTDELIVNGGQLASNTCLALDSLGTAHVGYYRLADLVAGYAYRSGPANWNETVMLSPVIAGSFASMALDSAERPVLTCYGEGLEYFNFDGAVWHRTILDSSGWLGHHTSMVFGSDGRVHISYLRADTSDLQYVCSLP